MKQTNEKKVSDREYREDLKQRRAERIAHSKAKDKAWQKMIRNLDYEELNIDKHNKDDIVLKPKKVGKGLVK